MSFRVYENTKKGGFTIIEILLVTLAIGIMVTVVLRTYSDISERQRNQERETRISKIHGQLEFYHGRNGFYPTLQNLNDSNWRSQNLPELEAINLQDPKSSEVVLVASPEANAFAYQVTPADCNNKKIDCKEYKLTATLEGGSTYTQSSLN